MKISVLFNLFMIYGEFFFNLFKLMDYLLILLVLLVEVEGDFYG